MSCVVAKWKCDQLSKVRRLNTGVEDRLVNADKIRRQILLDKVYFHALKKQNFPTLSGCISFWQLLFIQKPSHKPKSVMLRWFFQHGFTWRSVNMNIFSSAFGSTMKRIHYHMLARVQIIGTENEKSFASTRKCTLQWDLKVNLLLNGNYMNKSEPLETDEIAVDICILIFIFVITHSLSNTAKHQI